jgi:hypothetical protein
MVLECNAFRGKETGSSGKRVPGQFAREAAFFDVEEREEEEKAGKMCYREVE